MPGPFRPGPGPRRYDGPTPPEPLVRAIMRPPVRHWREGHARYDAPSAAVHRGDPLSTGPDGQERSVPPDGETGPDGRRELGPADGARAGAAGAGPGRRGYSPVRAGERKRGVQGRRGHTVARRAAQPR